MTNDMSLHFSEQTPLWKVAFKTFFGISLFQRFCLQCLLSQYNYILSYLTFFYTTSNATKKLRRKSSFIYLGTEENEIRAHFYKSLWRCRMLFHEKTEPSSWRSYTKNICRCIMYKIFIPSQWLLCCGINLNFRKLLISNFFPN